MPSITRLLLLAFGLLVVCTIIAQAQYGDWDSPPPPQPSPEDTVAYQQWLNDLAYWARQQEGATQYPPTK
jgi:hypothetical protein